MNVNPELYELLEDCGRVMNGEEDIISGVRSLYIRWRAHGLEACGSVPALNSARGQAMEEATHWFDVARLEAQKAKAFRENPDEDVFLAALQGATKALVRYIERTIEA